MFGGSAYLIFWHCVLGVCVHTAQRLSQSFFLWLFFSWWWAYIIGCGTIQSNIFFLFLRLPPPPFQLASLPELSEEFCSSINFLDTRGQIWQILLFHIFWESIHLFTILGGRGQIILTLAIVPRLESLRRWIWPEKYVHLIRSRWKDIILVELEKFSVLLFPISNGALQRSSMKNMKKLWWRWWLLGWWVYST